MNQNDFLFHKPKSFLTAHNLIYANIFVGILTAVVRYFNLGTDADKRNISMIIFTVASYIFTWFLSKMMSLCKKWARLVLVFVYLLLLASFAFAFSTTYVFSLMEIALMLTQAALMILAIVFFV